MNPPLAALVPCVPFAAAIALGLIGDRRLGGRRIGVWVNLAAAGATFLAALAFALEPPASSALLLADPLARHFALLAGFVGLTASCAEFGQAEPPDLAHALGQGFLGAVLAALMSNSLVVTIAAAEAACLALAAAAALPRTQAAIRAAWTGTVTAGLAGGLALFGVILLALAALPAAGAPALTAPALTWSALPQAVAAGQGGLLGLGFVFALVGAAAMAMLAPLHLWRSGREDAAPLMTTPLVTTLAITVILRLRQAVADTVDAALPGPAVLALGLLAVLIAALALGRQQEARRFVAVATVGQAGLVAVAIGLGTSAAVFAGVLHLTLATLLLTALLSPARTAGSGVTVAAGLVALAGLPPFGLFSGIVLIAAAAAHAAPLLLAPLGAGLGLSAWAMLARLPALRAPGAATSRTAPRAAGWARTGWARTGIIVPWLHLALTALLGLAMPIPLLRWFATIAGSLG